MTPGRVTPETEAAQRTTLAEALDAGWAILTQGGAAIDAVEAVVCVLEASGWFNAGKGAVRTTDGQIELDASIMDGHTGQGGGIAGVSLLRHPIRAARAVMDHSPHVLLIGVGAEQFIDQQQLERVSRQWFDQAPDTTILPSPGQPEFVVQPEPQPQQLPHPEGKYGTVGAVALDANGHLAAATSTGGTRHKLPGRVGDSPVLGAGTYAEDGVAAISCTGQGEFFLRQVLAYDVAARVKYQALPLGQAAEAAILGQLHARGGGGGLVAIGPSGVPVLVFNTPGMYRAWRCQGPQGSYTGVALYADAIEAPASNGPSLAGVQD
jgi:isoaspartyl peptidase/L-asparaginase-like protein (Ntn-hydrolase superfamily)